MSAIEAAVPSANPVTPNAQPAAKPANVPLPANANPPRNDPPPQLGDKNPAAAAPAEPEVQDWWEPSEDEWGRPVRVKVDGEYRKIPLREAVDGYQMREASNARFREVAKERAQYQAERAEWTAFEQEMSQTVQDPHRFFEYLVETDPSRAVEWVKGIYERAVQESQLTPDQQRLRMYERMEQQRQAEEQQRQTQAVYQQEKALWGKVLQAAELPQDDPMSRVVFQEMQSIVDRAKREGRQVPINALAEHGKRRYAELQESARQRMLASMSPEQRKALIRPEDVQDAARSTISQRGPVLQSTQPRNPNGQYASPAAPPKPRVYDPMIMGSLAQAAQQRER
jgi:hypothetical protein